MFMADIVSHASSTVSPTGRLGSFGFHGYDAAVYEDDRGYWVFVSQLSKFMGLDGTGQRQHILRNHWSDGWTCNMYIRLPDDKQSRKHFLLHERRLALWLGSITTGAIKDTENRARVEAQLTEFADALADALVDHLPSATVWFPSHGA
jgi:hypothetical protein